jgi:transposase
VNTEQIAQLARSALRQKLPELRLALDCTVQPHHRMMLRDQLARLDSTGAEIAKYDATLAEQVKPCAQHIELLCSIDGIQRTAAIEIFAEVGPTLATFPSDGHFRAWAGTSPGLHESTGKRKRGRRQRGNPYLTNILVECSLAATRKKDTYLRDK